VQILAQGLGILVTTTYPKSSSRAWVDFAETPIEAFHIPIFQAKTKSQKYIHIWKKL
jgi:hypothetical protein